MIARAVIARAVIACGGIARRALALTPHRRKLPSGRVRRPLFIAVALVAALGCEPDPRNDANLFLERVQRIDLDDTIAARTAMVDSLEALPLGAPEVTTARDTCVSAHRAILSAETLHARARAAVAAGEGTMDRARIERDIQESNRQIERSRPLFTRCHRLTRDLDVRYRSRRAAGGSGQ